MPKTSLYYHLKPYLPWRLRVLFRRILARSRQRAHKDVWPICEPAGKQPAGWPGWPEGKKFAFVLTHDVEGLRGLAKSRQLMALEQQAGFKSSFNFIPEGDYRVSRELREELEQNGFEVGVHDLHHDGKLYRNRDEFEQKAAHINRYLKEWGVSGFRSGFMHHALDWAHDLNIKYDASTFDIDPFEPQPDGVHTIFPFWVSAPDGRGYVELPYTLPQDFTLFVLLKEQGPEIWKQKLEWIVKHGGMALVDVHPDYLDFEGQRAKGSEYPAAWYQEFLHHVKETYAGTYWNALPRDVADWYGKIRLGLDGQNGHNSPNNFSGGAQFQGTNGYAGGYVPEKKRVAVVLQSYYESDPRPRREAEALCRAGMEVEVICLRSDASKPSHETINGVKVTRIRMRHRRSIKAIYVIEYLWFLLAATALLSFRSLKRRYRVVHVHNMPDILVFSAFMPRLLGAKVILDMHDPMPELCRGIYGLPQKHFLVRCLRRMEKMSLGFADMVLTPNISFRELFIARGLTPEKSHIVMNSPDTRIFTPKKVTDPTVRSQADRPFNLMYHGLLVERHGLDLAVRAVAQVRRQIPQVRLHFYGAHTPYLEEILALVRELGLDDVVQYHGWKPLAEIAKAIETIDVGLVPNRLNPFTEINLPTRIFEYLAMNKLVIAPRTKGIRDYFQDNDLLFFEPGDAADLAGKLTWTFENPLEAQQLLARGRQIYQQHRWDTEEKRFVGLVRELVAPTFNGRRIAAPVPKRICMITHSIYESDNRVMRYATSLAAQNNKVDVFALKREPNQAAFEIIDGVNVHRIQPRADKNRQGKSSYLFPLLKFFVLSSVRLSWRQLRRPYDVIHVHNVPDFLVFAAWLPWLMGTKIILDIHDMVPEFYASKFQAAPGGLGVKMLTKVETASAHFAHHVIISNHLWHKVFIKRSAHEGKCSVYINWVDSKVFYRRKRIRSDGKLVIMFPGGLQWHQGLDIAIRAFARLPEKFPQAEFHIYGDGNMKDELIALVKELGLTKKVHFFNPLPASKIAQVMADADLGVVPKRADSFGNEAYSTKIMEFMSVGVPVVVSSTKIDRFYFNDSVVRFFESGNVDALAQAMTEVLSNPELRQNMIAQAAEYTTINSWDVRKVDYLQLVDSLCSVSRN